MIESTTLNASAARGALRLAMRTGRNAYAENTGVARTRFTAVRTRNGVLFMRATDGRWFAIQSGRIVIA